MRRPIFGFARLGSSDIILITERRWSGGKPKQNQSTGRILTGCGAFGKPVSTEFGDAAPRAAPQAAWPRKRRGGGRTDRDVSETRWDMFRHGSGQVERGRVAGPSGKAVRGKATDAGRSPWVDRGGPAKPRADPLGTAEEDTGRLRKMLRQNRGGRRVRKAQALAGADRPDDRKRNAPVSLGKRGVELPPKQGCDAPAQGLRLKSGDTGETAAMPPPLLRFGHFAFLALRRSGSFVLAVFRAVGGPLVGRGRECGRGVRAVAPIVSHPLRCIGAGWRAGVVRPRFRPFEYRVKFRP